MGNSSSSEVKRGESSGITEGRQFKGVNGVPFEEEHHHHQQQQQQQQQSKKSAHDKTTTASSSTAGSSSSAATQPPVTPSSFDDTMSIMSEEDMVRETQQLEGVINQLEVDLAEAKGRVVMSFGLGGHPLT